MLKTARQNRQPSQKNRPGNPQQDDLKKLNTANRINHSIAQTLKKAKTKQCLNRDNMRAKMIQAKIKANGGAGAPGGVQTDRQNHQRIKPEITMQTVMGA